MPKTYWEHKPRVSRVIQETLFEIKEHKLLY